MGLTEHEQRALGRSRRRLTTEVPAFVVRLAMPDLDLDRPLRIPALGTYTQLRAWFQGLGHQEAHAAQGAIEDPPFPGLARRRDTGQDHLDRPAMPARCLPALRGTAIAEGVGRRRLRRLRRAGLRRGVG